MKTVLGLAVGVVLLVAGCGRQKQSAATWQTIKADDNSYTVTMPAQPKSATQSVDVPQGKIEIHMQELATTYVNYTAGYSQYPAGFLTSMGSDAEVLFDKARDATVKQKSARLIEDKKGTTGGFPNRTVIMQFAMPENGGDVRMQQVMILAKERMYIAQTLMLAAAPKDAEQDAARFHQSLVLDVK